MWAADYVARRFRLRGIYQLIAERYLATINLFVNNHAVVELLNKPRGTSSYMQAVQHRWAVCV